MYDWMKRVGCLSSGTLKWKYHTIACASMKSYTSSVNNGKHSAADAVSHKIMTAVYSKPSWMFPVSNL